MKQKRALDLDGAETIAIAGLAFLAQDVARMGRFIALTGMGPDVLRQRARDSATLAAVLQHFLTDESLLLVFTSEAGISPEAIEPAHRLLAAATGGET